MTEDFQQTSASVRPPAQRGAGWGKILPIITLVIITLAVFWPVTGHQFLAWDDSVDVYKNPYLQVPSVDNLLHFWRYPYERLYTPLTYTIYALLAWTPLLLKASPGAAVIPDPGLFHAFNLVLHLLSVLILWRILLLLLMRSKQKEIGAMDNRDALPLSWAACGGALLFAIHPLQVEPVSWVAGMKDLVFGLFSLLAIWHYLLYVDQKTLPGRRPRVGLHFGFATGAYLLALFAKPTAVVVPLMVGFLAGSVWRQPWRAQLSGLWVWFLFAVAWGLLTRWVQTGAILAFEPPLWARPLIAGDAVAFYLYKLAVPLRLGPDYGRTPQYVLAHGWLFITGLAPYALAIWLWVRRKRLPWLWTAAGIFAVVLLPVSGVISFEFQRFSTVADRYVYLAMIGPAFASAWVLSWPQKKLAAIGGIMVLGFLLLHSSRQVRYWHDTQTFFEHALKINATSFLALNNLGFALAAKGQDVEAIRLFNQALLLEPDSAVTHLNLANALVRQGKLAEGIEHYSEALRLVPNFARAHTNLGLALAKLGRHLEAIDHHREALRIEPKFADAHNNLALELAQRGEFEEAMQHYTAALRLNPRYIDAHTNAGIALASQKRLDEALHHFSEALRIEATAKAHANLAGVLLQQMKLKEAELHYIEALRLNPHYKNAHLRLSTILVAQGEFDRARYHVTEVLRLDPNNNAARQILARIEFLDRSSKTQ